VSARLRSHGALLSALLVLTSFGCDRPATTHTPMIVFASASLTAPFEAMGERFEKRHDGAELELHVAGTPQLVLQIREGAPADVFASADSESMQRVLEQLPPTSRPVPFATNHLAIVTAAGNPERIEGLADLARPGLSIALCGPAVPAGRYAREALAKANVRVRSVSDEPSVNALVTKVRLGEIDAGIVYRTDAASAGDGVATVPIAREHDVVARYWIAALPVGARSDLGADFVRFVLSTEGQGILGSFGFAAP